MPAYLNQTLPATPAFRQLLLQPGQYRNCHIRVPDLEQRLPAIVLEGRYYSFLKVVRDKDKALDIMARLFDRGDDSRMTQTAKGFVIWVLEPEAIPTSPQEKLA